MVAAQCKIAFVWRMNRIKIKLARKKREKDEAAKKKAMAQKGKYYHYGGSNVKTQNSSVNKNTSGTSGTKAKPGLNSTAGKPGATPVTSSQSAKKPPSTYKAAAVGSLMKSLVSAAQEQKASPANSAKPSPGAKNPEGTMISQGLKNAD